MEIIMKNEASLTGMLDKSTGYFIQERKGRFFAVRRKNFDAECKRGNVNFDGHLQTIFHCARLAGTSYCVADIRVSALELYCAIHEAHKKHLAFAFGVKAILNAQQVLDLKQKYNL